ncbi:nicotinamide riboside transporter PnuC [[Acholeplasma] multilocale]|uniref:nicotinamide riboside transporter PnuC n=1 Tax=[Acholeplasma] multilocale TaxID=264638 RepID=UPI0004787ED0|nr:nicotinamide riboside transporter PnuC [[Acholeplasma] multilocale]
MQIEQTQKTKKHLIKDMNYLGLGSAWQDLKRLPNWFKTLLLVGAIIVIFFNFFSIETLVLDVDAPKEILKYSGTHFAPFIQYAKAYMNGSVIGPANSHGLALATAILYSLNGVAAFTGLLSVAMIVNGKMSQFLWGLINGVFYAMFALVAGFIGDFIMNVTFVLGASLGWYLFNYRHKGQFTIRGRDWYWKTTFFLVVGLLIVAFTFVWYYLIPEIYNATLSGSSGTEYVTGTSTHIFDSVGNGVNVVGYGMQLMNVSEQFWLWTFLNVWKILQYTPIGLGEGQWVVTLLIQFGVWTILGLVGLWQNQLKYIYQWARPFISKK